MNTISLEDLDVYIKATLSEEAFIKLVCEDLFYIPGFGYCNKKALEQIDEELKNLKNYE